MAGLVPAIHALTTSKFRKGVDARHKAGHDESYIFTLVTWPILRPAFAVPLP